MDIKELLISAKQAVEEAEVPQDLRPVAFSKAFEFIAGPERPRVDAPLTASQGSQSNTSPQTGSKMDLISEKLNLDVNVVGEVFHVENDEIQIIVPPTKLEKGMTGATKEIALLVAAGRQGAGDEESTSLEEIRYVAEDYKKYDQANFSRTVNAMSDEFRFLGKGKGRSVKISRPGWNTASQLVSKLGGGEA